MGTGEVCNSESHFVILHVWVLYNVIVIIIEQLLIKYRKMNNVLKYKLYSKTVLMNIVNLKLTSKLDNLPVSRSPKTSSECQRTSGYNNGQ